MELELVIAAGRQRERCRRCIERRRRRGREHLEARRATVATGRHWTAVDHRELAAVALVADDDVARAEDVAVANARARERPELGSVDDVPATRVRHARGNARVAAARERNAGQPRLGPPEDRIGPDGRREPCAVGTEYRILAEAVLEADLRLAFETDLPVARVSGKERRVAAGGDE